MSDRRRCRYLLNDEERCVHDAVHQLAFDGDGTMALCTMHVYEAAIVAIRLNIVVLLSQEPNMFGRLRTQEDIAKARLEVAGYPDPDMRQVFGAAITRRAADLGLEEL